MEQPVRAIASQTDGESAQTPLITPPIVLCSLFCNSLVNQAVFTVNSVHKIVIYLIRATLINVTKTV